MSDLYEVIDSSAAKFGYTHGLFCIRRGLRFRAPEARDDADSDDREAAPEHSTDEAGVGKLHCI